LRKTESGRSPILRVGSLLVFGIIALSTDIRLPGTRLFAQEPPLQLPKPLKHEVTVTLKLIQVIVTDKKGNPVTGLKKEDFILTDNGKLMTLTEFEKHDLRLPAAPGKVEERVATTPIPAGKLLLNRKFFLVFDFALMEPQGARKAAEAALRFIDTGLIPADDVAVISFSMRKRFQLHENLTTDHEKVREAVERFGLMSSTGRYEGEEERLQRDKEQFQRLRETGETGDASSDMPGPEALIAPVIDDQRVFYRIYIDSLMKFAQALRYIPGQKTFVFFSGGIPGRVLHQPIIPSFEMAGKYNTDLNSLYGQLCLEMASSNITVYPLNTDPLLPPGEIIPPPESETGAPLLKTMAKVTGGQYFGNIFNFAEHMEKIQTMTGTYYVLGYRVGEKWDGAYHKIQVKVNKPGYEVRAQAGYFSPRLYADYTEIEKKMHLVDLALSPKPLSQVPVRFSMTAFFCSGGETDNLCSIAEIPVDKIRDVSQGKAEAISLIFNAADDIVSLNRSEQNFAELAETKAYFVTLHTVPPGRAYKCRVVVRDIETGRAAVASAPSVFIAPGQGIQLYPPLFFVADRGARYIPAESAKNSKRDSAVPISRVFPLDSGQYAPQIEKRVRRDSEIWAGIRCRAAGPAQKIKLSAFLVDKITAEQIPIPLEIVAERFVGDEAAFFVRLRIPAVEPDEYRFVLGAEDSAGGTTSQLGCDFIIDEEDTGFRRER
jgi:VWFA-related protein